ncbi:MAG: hypothetical protein WBE18_02985 [Gammaproteobacteria bacterium]
MPKYKKSNSSKHKQVPRQAANANNHQKNLMIELQAKYLAEINYLNYLGSVLNVETVWLLAALLHWVVLKWLIDNDQPLLVSHVYPGDISALPIEEIMSLEYRLYIMGLTFVTPFAFTKLNPLFDYLFPVGFARQILKLLVGTEEVPDNEATLRSSIDKLEKFNSRIFNISAGLARSGIVVYPLTIFTVIKTVLNSNASSYDFLFCMGLRNVATLFASFVTLADKLKYNQDILGVKNTHFFNNLQKIIEDFSISWERVGIIDQPNTYFKLRFPLRNRKEWHFNIRGKEHSLSSKLVIKNICKVLQIKLKAAILASNSTTILVGSLSNKDNNVPDEQVDLAKDLLVRRLLKHEELRINLPNKLTQLNEIAEISDCGNWWHIEIERDDLPEIQFCLFCADEEKGEQLVEHLNARDCQAEIKSQQILVVGCNPINSKQFEQSLDQLRVLFNHKIVANSDNPNTINPTSVIESPLLIEESNTEPERVKSKTKGGGHRWFGGFSLFAPKKELQGPRTINWDKKKYNEAYSKHPEDFKKFNNYGGKLFAYFNTKHLARKLGNAAEEFHSVFNEKDFIGRGYVMNESGHVLDEKGYFKLKKMGHAGGIRVLGKIEALGPDGEMLIEYRKVRTK